jgi:hypothetical protein
VANGRDYAELGHDRARRQRDLGVALISRSRSGFSRRRPRRRTSGPVCLLRRSDWSHCADRTVIYVFSTATFSSVIFLIWSIFVGLLDNVLKPVAGAWGQGSHGRDFCRCDRRVPRPGIIATSAVLGPASRCSAWLAEPLQPSEERQVSILLARARRICRLPNGSRHAFNVLVCSRPTGSCDRDERSGIAKIAGILLAAYHSTDVAGLQDWAS